MLLSCYRLFVLAIVALVHLDHFQVVHLDHFQVVHPSHEAIFHFSKEASAPSLDNS